MPSMCVVQNCTSKKSAKNSHDGEHEISFHKFPHKNENLCQKWILSLALAKLPKKNSKVCSVHFQTTDFVTFSVGKRKLKKGAIPTIKISGKIPRIIKHKIQPKAYMHVPIMRDASTQTDEDYSKLRENKWRKRTAEPITSTPSRKTCETEDMDTSMEATIIEIGCSPNLSMDASISEIGCNSRTSDSTYQPTSDNDSYADVSYMDMNADIIDPSEPTYIIFAKPLFKLFTFCNKCLMSEVPRATRCKIVEQLVNGTMLSIVTKCTFGHKVKWSSQPLVKNKPLGNLLLSASLLYSGGELEQVLHMFKNMNLQCFSRSTFYRLQRAYLEPTVKQVWESEQTKLLEERQATPITIGGDGRCDSPGHCAKYCTYYTMDLVTNKVIDVQLIQCNEVQNSTNMEKEGLKRSLAYLTSAGLHITRLVTDRHIQVRQFMRLTYPAIQHKFDIWHFAKALKKKLVAASKVKRNAELSPWIGSICNHLYWSVVTSDDNEQLIVEKWLSVLQHITNIHEHHGEMYKRCGHETVDRNWMTSGGAAHKSLERIVSAKRIVKDIKQLSSTYQTSGLECLQNIVIHFAPKHTHYFYKGMRARCYLAALHYNENGNKAIAVKHDGKPCYKLTFDKKRQGRPTVSAIKQHSTYGYVSTLMLAALEMFQTKSYTAAGLENEEIIPPYLSSAHNSISKEEVLRSQMSRFSRPEVDPAVCDIEEDAMENMEN